MQTYQIKLTRDAQCSLETTVEVRANSREEAENLAIGMAETGEADFTVTDIDLTAHSGSSEVAA